MTVSPRDALLIIEDSVQTHLRNGTNVTRTMNAFMIYRNEYKHMHPNNNSCRNLSKLAAELWSKEPEDVKSYYKRIAKQVKERYKKISPTQFFNLGTFNQVSTNDNSISLETSYSIPQNTIQNSSVTTYNNFPILNMNDNSAYSNSQFMNMETPLDMAFPSNMNLKIQNKLPESLFSENPSVSDVYNPQISNFDPSVNVNSSLLNDASCSDPQHIYPDLQFVNINSQHEGQFSVLPTFD
ncbi:622_t:CDS:1 [Diversispora eburnea]|uniref:622_t:CDS:1 n=1 Tax=Diversispora eburnea TaxID=1213867 RepID=A0A9N8WGS8_9GLOM|nr:622_t:CDS:1 [Diversispora eburnea]